MFDIFSDADEPETQVKNETSAATRKVPKRESKRKEVACVNSKVKQTCTRASQVGKASKSPVQKDITSYGKIRKDNTSEWMKKGSLRKSPKSKTISKISPEHKLKV